MSLVSQLPGPSDVYNIFRVMLNEVKILKEQGYSLGKYEYLTETTISESEAYRITKHSKFPPLHLTSTLEFDTESSSDAEAGTNSSRSSSEDETKDATARTHSSDAELQYSEGLKYLKFAREYKVKPDNEWDLKEDFFLTTIVEEYNLKTILREKDVKKRILPRDGEEIVNNLSANTSLPIIYETNPLAAYMNAKQEDIIEVITRSESKDKKFYYIRVVPVPQPNALTVVVCDPDNVLKIVEEEMATKSKKTARGKNKQIRDWVFITKIPTDTDRIIIPQGYGAKFRHFQHLYIDPLTHVKSPPGLRKMPYRESFDLKTQPTMKSLRFPSISIEDPIAVRLDANPKDIIELRINNIFSEQTTDGIVFREVRG